MSVDARSKFRGCLLGGAVGDALGAAIEFDSLAAIRTKHGPEGLSGYAPAYGRVGAITDDTQMTLFTAEGMIRGITRQNERGICHPATVIGHAYQRWLKTQGFAANLPRAADGWLIEQEFLHDRRAPGHTCVTALQSGSGENHSKGCGGVMRVAPIGLALESPFDLAAEAAAITHGHPTGSLAAGAFADIIARVLRDEPLPAAVKSAMELLAARDDHEETTSALRGAVAAAMIAPPSPSQVEKLGEGWVAEEALGISLYCALTAPDFGSGLLTAVNHGGDSDSTGAITGNLLGAMRGVEVIPPELLDAVEGRDVIERIADDLHDVFVAGETPDAERYPGW